MIAFIVACHLVVGSSTSQFRGATGIGTNERDASVERTATTSNVVWSIGSDSREPVVVDKERGTAPSTAAESK